MHLVFSVSEACAGLVTVHGRNDDAGRGLDDQNHIGRSLYLRRCQSLAAQLSALPPADPARDATVASVPVLIRPLHYEIHGSTRYPTLLRPLAGMPREMKVRSLILRLALPMDHWIVPPWFVTALPTVPSRLPPLTGSVLAPCIALVANGQKATGMSSNTANATPHDCAMIATDFMECSNSTPGLKCPNFHFDRSLVNY